MRRGPPPLPCSVCGRLFTTGGLRGERGPNRGRPPLCPAHYHRAYRGSARADDPAPGFGQRPRKAELLRRLEDALHAFHSDHLTAMKTGGLSGRSYRVATSVVDPLISAWRAWDERVASHRRREEAKRDGR